jgi:hypothetical protein
MTEKMDELEKFVSENRKDLDQYSPSENIWKEIESGIKRRKTSRIIWFSSAAMVLIILGTTAIFHRYFTDPLSPKPLNNENLLLINSDPQVREAEIYYSNLIKDLYNEALPMLTSDPELKQELNSDLSKLDTICLEIKKDLKDNVSNQEVIEALINNYRIKIRILNDMLDLLKQDENNTEKTKNNAL